VDHDGVSHRLLFAPGHISAAHSLGVNETSFSDMRKRQVPGNVEGGGNEPKGRAKAILLEYGDGMPGKAAVRAAGGNLLEGPDALHFPSISHGATMATRVHPAAAHVIRVEANCRRGGGARRSEEGKQDMHQIPPSSAISGTRPCQPSRILRSPGGWREGGGCGRAKESKCYPPPSAGGRRDRPGIAFFEGFRSPVAAAGLSARQSKNSSAGSSGAPACVSKREDGRRLEKKREYVAGSATASIAALDFYVALLLLSATASRTRHSVSRGHPENTEARFHGRRTYLFPSMRRFFSLHVARWRRIRDVLLQGCLIPAAHR
jgi:hypothetical protein